MATVDYSNHFWGDKHVGYHVLYENLKHGETVVQELNQFLKERIVFEEETLKFYNKACNRSSVFAQSTGSFADSWRVTKGTMELMVEIQTTLLKNLNDLGKDITKYHSDLVKSRKRVKEQDVVDAVNIMQTTTTCLQKAKETYTQRCAELEKLHKESSSQKEISKCEVKVIKARDEYKQYVEKHAKIRDNFEEKMVKASRAFQAHDEAHLLQVRNFFTHFARSIEDGYSAAAQVSAQYRETMQAVNVEELMTKFVEERGTGGDRPEAVDFEEIDVAADLPTSIISSSNSAPSSSNSSAIVPNIPPIAAPSASDLLSLETAWNIHTGTTSDSVSTIGAIGTTSVLDLTTTAPKSPSGSDSGSSATNNHPFSGPSQFSTSLGRQKLSMWLPKRNKKSQSSLSVNEGPVDFSQSHNETSFAGGFLKKRHRKSKKSLNELNAPVEASKDRILFDDSKSVASSCKSDDKSASLFSNSFDASGFVGNGPVHLMDMPIEPALPGNSRLPVIEKEMKGKEPQIDEEGYTIRKENEGNRGEDQWSSDSSDDDDDDMQASKIRQLNIKPLNESTPKMNASVDELRNAIDSIQLQSTLNRSSTFDTDPWSSTAAPFSQSLNAHVRTMRPCLTGDEHLRRKYTDSDFGSSSQLPFSQSITGSAISRARPRSNTPTFSSSAIGLHFSNHNFAPNNSTSIVNSANRRGSNVGDSTAFERSDSVNSLGGCAHSFESPFSISQSNLLKSAATINEHRVPIGIAQKEFSHAWFKGADTSKATLKVMGTVVLSFPSSVVDLLTDIHSDVEPLRFSLQNALKIKSIIPNKQMVLPTPMTTPSATHKFTLDRLGVANWLIEQRKKSPDTSFYNIDIVRYELVDPEAPPLLFTSYWKLEPTHTDLRVDYRLNTDDNGIGAPLLNVTFMTKVSGNISSVNSDPTAKWSAEEKTLSWNLTEITRHGACSGSLKARVHLTEGPSVPEKTFVQFETNDASISGANIVLDTDDTYHLSLVRRKVVSGKFFCEPEVRK